MKRTVYLILFRGVGGKTHLPPRPLRARLSEAGFDLHTPHGFGKSKMAARFDQWIGVTSPARNWNTVLKVAELGHAAETGQRSR